MTTVIKYPYDPTGIAETNLVLGETISLPRTNNRAFAVNYGLFYAESLKIRHIGTGTILTTDDYKCLGEHQEATRLTNKLVTSVVYITNAKYADGFTYDYQALGGELHASVAVIEQLIRNLGLDGRSVSWDDVLDKPTEMPPTAHMHDVGDLYGLEAVVAAINQLSTSVTSGDTVLKEQVIAQLGLIYSELTAVKTIQQQNSVKLSQLTDRLTAIGA